MKNIFILGCGFGTGLAVLWSKAGHAVTAYSNNAEEITMLAQEREHKRLLPGVKIPDTVRFTADIAEASKANIIVFAVPSKFVGQAAGEIAPYVRENAVIVNVGKGFCSTESYCRLSEVIDFQIKQPATGNRQLSTVLTGPCHAEEVGRGYPTSVVAAGVNAQYVQEVLQTPTFRIYTNDDIIGCELGGALKNPIALCSGIARGMGLGDNAAAALVTRGLAEITRLGVALGAKAETFAGLAGVGDLIVTCMSEHSRNNRAGYLIGQGMPASEAVAQVGTVEGYECVGIAVKLARQRGIEIPIFEKLYRVCYEGLSPRDALTGLMERPQRPE
ncbi:MAG: NAD(P)-dependent glycerol-3-phosphate dehydrogenase [Oscillospiraceae bacterium]|nr:NAD(P)-dependent glycerol-3-phosphate dehydrogenase [Oscillospiraceae bacterium]